MFDEIRTSSPRIPDLYAAVPFLMLSPLLLVLLPIFILVLFAWPVSILITRSHLRKTRKLEEKLSEEMQRKGRTIKWANFLQAVNAYHGTVIEERHSFKGPVYLWWTPDNVRTLSPYPIADWFTMQKDKEFGPFARWCYERYTSTETGSALLLSADPAYAKEASTLWRKYHECESEQWIDIVPPQIFLRRKFGLPSSS